MIKITKIVNRLNRKQINLRPRKGDRISLIYFDLERESVRVQAFNGLCIKTRFCGVNSRIKLAADIGSYSILKSFFLNSPVIVDWKIKK